MAKPRTRAWIAATILTTLLIPAVAAPAGPRDRLEEIEERRRELQEQIDVHESQASDLQARVNELNREMIALRTELGRLDEDIARIESRVRTVQARIDATQAEIDKIEDLATKQAEVLYKSGAGEALDALLNSDSLAELDDRIQLLGVAAQQNTDELVRFGRLRLEIEAHHRELFAREQELEAVRKSKATVLADIDAKHKELEAHLVALERKLGKEQAREGDLADAAAEIRQDILARQAGAAVAARGVSASGFAWPLNGAITSYYGPRWGRMHTGIDIDGVSGQPIVASKAGRVIVASYYGGYGNAVVIDHGGGVSTLYGHMSSFGVSNGQSVSQGQVVGNVGCTGSCTGDHLHFEVRVNGSPVNPLDYLP